MKLSIEELRDVIANAKTSLEQYLALELIATIRELKGEQVPVTWPDMPFSFEELEQMHGATFANGYVRGWARKCESVTMKGSLYTAPQKWVVLPEKSINDYNRYWIDYQDTVAAIEAAGGIVKDGE